MYGKPEFQSPMPKKRGVPILSMVEAVLILGGFMIFAGFFMDWVTYYNYGHGVVSIKGAEFGRIVGNYPETFLLPFIGLMFIAGAVFSAGRRRAYVPQRVSRGLFLASAWIAAIIAMFISVWLTIRYADYLHDNIGITIYNSLELGWFITISGNMILYIGCILAVSAKARGLGFTDYYFVRADSVERASELVRPPIPAGLPPQGPGPQPMPPAGPRPGLPSAGPAPGGAPMAGMPPPHPGAPPQGPPR